MAANNTTQINLTSNTHTTMSTVPTTTAAKKKRGPRKDRSKSKYSEEDFRKMPRDQQFELAQKYMMLGDDEFDDGTFQISKSQFCKVCNELGIKKETSVIDTQAVKKASEGTVLYIEHGKRKTERNNWTYSEGTSDKVDRLLGDIPSTMERSKLIDKIFNDALDQLLEEKGAGRLYWDYKRTDEKKKL